MKWELLKKNLCPYCESILIFDGEQEIECTSCRFHISPVRYKAIAEKRTDTTPTIRLRWQNLREGRCPQCGEDLRDGNGKFEITICTKQPLCTFKIRNDKYDEIMADPLHPAHQYPI